MKIKSITNQEIIFDNGDSIYYTHESQHGEHNYADFFKFKQDHGCYWVYSFSENITLEPVGNSGFRFGNYPDFHFISCYSKIPFNGAAKSYPNELTIWYNNKASNTKTSITINCNQHFG